MKVSKKHLQRIIQEEIQNTLAEVVPPVPPPEEEKPEVFNKTAARAGAKARHKQGAGAIADVGGMTPLEGGIEARLQKIHNELAAKGEIAGASRIVQMLNNILKLVGGGQ